LFVLIEFLLNLISAGLVASLSSIFLGVIYFFIAAGIVNFFELNRGKKNFWYQFFNEALIATVLSFFLIFAFFMKG